MPRVCRGIVGSKIPNKAGVVMSAPDVLREEAVQEQRPMKLGFGRGCKALYVNILLALLPHLINLTRHFSKKIRAELAYLKAGYAFQMKVERTSLECVCRLDANKTMHAVPPSRRATDSEYGSGLPSADPNMVTVDYVIAFRSLDYAFDCFTGSMSLQEALAQRAFTTRGPNDTGVSLTYMFTALLRMFFFWRKPYRMPQAQPAHL